MPGLTSGSTQLLVKSMPTGLPGTTVQWQGFPPEDP